MGSRFRIVIVAGVLVAASVIGARPALADPTTDIRWSQPTAAATVSIGAVANSGGSAWRAPAVRFFSRVLDSYCIYAGGGGCVQTKFICDANSPTPVLYTTYNPDAPLLSLPANVGTIVLYDSEPIGDPYLALIGGSVGEYCAAPAVASAGVQRAPTAEEIWRDASIAGEAPTVEVLPTGHGLTGLETPLWLTLGGTTARPINVAYGPWTVRATVFLRRIDWRVADAATDTIVATQGSIPPNGDAFAGGSRTNPLTQFRFRTKGNYRVTGTAVWGASGTISGPFGYVRTIDFPDAGLSSSYDYPVDELVGVLNR